MRVFSRSSGRRTLAVAGAAALVLAVLAYLTGGIVVHVAGLRISVRGIERPVAIGVLAWLAFWFTSRPGERAALAARLSGLAGALVPVLSRHAAATALVLAACTAGVGVGFGVFAAHATDPAGYVSQSALIAAGRMSWQEPLARDVQWPNREWAFGPLGYRPTHEPATYVPTYPPGLPLWLAAGRAVGGEEGLYVVVPLFGALLVLCTYGIGRHLHSPLAGVIAAVLAATSPVVLFHATHVMSDVPAAAWWALATLCALSRARGLALAGGLAAGFAILTRPNLAPVAVPVALLALGWPRRARPGVWAVSRLWAFASGVALMLGGLLVWQQLVYGSVFQTGYGDDVGSFFATANILPNVADYAWRLVRGEAPALWLAATSLTVVALHRPGRAERMGRVVAPATAAAAFASVVLASYLPYGVFPDWAYFRFLLPALPTAWALTGALVSEAVAVRPSVGGVVLAGALALAVAGNVRAAEREQAFRLHVYERRYHTVGRYLEASQPRNAVVVTSQQSGSVRYYTGLPVVRWDRLAVPLEAAVADLRVRGRHVVLVIEDWERPALRARFPGSRFARLDWRPRAEFGDATHVWLFDLLDAQQPAAEYSTDVVH